MKLRGTREQYGFLLHRNCFLLINVRKFYNFKIFENFIILKFFENFERILMKFLKVLKFYENLESFEILSNIQLNF
jgi:hypothetical protein